MPHLVEMLRCWGVSGVQATTRTDPKTLSGVVNKIVMKHNPEPQRELVL